MKSASKASQSGPRDAEEVAQAAAEEEEIKRQLVRRIALTLQGLGWTQREAAECLGVDQPKVSALTGGNFAGFTVSRLLRFVTALGHDVDILIKPRERGSKKRGRVKVVME